MLTAKEFNVGYICSHKEWFKVNREYQRESDIWSADDKKHLIDTILKDLDIPKIYLKTISDKRFEIIDGQQRIETIWQFKNNKFSLDGNISGEGLDGKKYKDLPSELVEQFDNFQLTCILLMNFNDEKTRLLFSKLQRGKPLNPAEKLNAYPGSIVRVMRKVGKHCFFSKVPFSLKRYKAYHLAARILLLEKYGISDISPSYLYDFYDKNNDLKTSSPLYAKTNKTLNYLDRVFTTKAPELSSDTWVINCYLLASDLIEKYVTKGTEKTYDKFYKDFWQKVENAKITGTGTANLMKFVDANSSGTTSKKNITTRFEMMKKEYIEYNPKLEFLDSKRNFDYFEKAYIYRRDKGICQKCKKKTKLKDFEADHIIAYIKGGKTTIANGQVLCSKCNAKKGAR